MPEETKSIQVIIAERIQTEFIRLMPLEDWTRLVESEVKKFNAPTGYHKEGPSPLRAMIQQNLEARFKKKVEFTLSSMVSTEWTDGDCPAATDAVAEMVKKIAPELWQLAVANVVQKAVDGFRTQIASLQY